MIAALRGAVYEALTRKEEMRKLYERLSGEAKDNLVKDFFKVLADDCAKDTYLLKRLDLHSIIKFGLAIKFEVPKFEIDERLIKTGVKDLQGAKEILKLAGDELNADIEYYEHIAAHSIFPEVKRLFRIIGDKELEAKYRIKAFVDLLE
jgi:hypothetical protein